MKLVLMDRDGVLNEDRRDYVKSPNELKLIAGSAAACARLNAAGIKIAVVTNQSAVGRGIISIDMLERVHERLRHLLAQDGARIDLLLTCTDAPERASDRRKPGPGMLREALSHFRCPPSAAVMVGDQLSDMRAAVTAGVRRVLVRTGKGADFQASGIPEDILPITVYDDLDRCVSSLLAEL